MRRVILVCFCAGLISVCSAKQSFAQSDDATTSAEQGLVGHWKLPGDSLDYSGQRNNAVNHGVNLDSAEFNGNSAYLEVPNSSSLRLGLSDFALCAWIWTAQDFDDVVGDVIDMYDPAARRGITLCINSSAGGYQSQGSDRHVYFGIDNGQLSEWEDCGRPSPTSNYVSNSMTVFDGHLYAATCDAKDESGWCHVYRYDGGQKWIDCGRVGDRRTTGVMPLIVHDGALYATTTTYDWTRVRSGKYDAGRVYRYLGGTNWEDCGQPSPQDNTLNCMASYKGKLYVGGGWQEWGVFVQEGDKQWKASKLFPMEGPQKCFPHTMSRYHGKLYVGWPCVYSFDGTEWKYAGVPVDPVDILQTHSLQVYQGHLCAGTWPEGKVARYLGGEKWEVLGRVGEDGTEVNALVVYNGKLYAGSIPRAEVCRYDDTPQWTSLKRFYSPDGWTPAPPAPFGHPTREQVAEWSRVTSLTVYDGKLFASTGSCTSSVLDAPADVRGKVFSIKAGECISYDRDLGPGWKHLAAVREHGKLKLYVGGQLVASSSPFNAEDYDLSIDGPLRIGFGQTDYFSGKIADVRVYKRALSEKDIQQIAARAEHPGP